MSDRQVSFLLDGLLQLKERVTASEVKYGQLESQYREAQEKNAQHEDHIKVLQTQMGDLRQQINEEKIEKQINFNDLLNYMGESDDSGFVVQNDPQIDPAQNDAVALNSSDSLIERIRNLEEKDHELEKNFQQNSSRKFDEPSTISGILNDESMKTSSSADSMVEADIMQVEDFNNLNENMVDNASISSSTSTLYFESEKENVNEESFTILYQSFKSASTEEKRLKTKTKRGNQYARNFKMRSTAMSKPPNSSILRPATKQPNYLDVSIGNESHIVVPSHTCILCSKSYKKRSNLVAHTAKMHSGSNHTFELGPGFCSKCLKSCKNSRGLKQHQQLCHSGGEKPQCSSGPVAVAVAAGQSTSASTSTNLENQTIEYETEVVSFNCPHCDIKFRQKSQLKGHLKIHTSKMYECPNCQKVFKTRSHLVEHLKTQYLTPKE